jgi:hypothetical protein
MSQKFNSRRAVGKQAATPPRLVKTPPVSEPVPTQPDPGLVPIKRRSRRVSGPGGQPPGLGS